MKFLILALTVAAPFAFAGKPSLSERPVCRSEKFVGPVVTQATGCENDGAMDFCLPRGDLALQAQVAALYPNIVCFNGSQSRGRAECDALGDEVLCLYKISRPECASRSAMTDAGWDRFCGFTQLDVVERIAPTWYE